MCNIFKQTLVMIFVLLTFGVCSPVLRAADSYYMMVFTYLGNPNVPRLAHTFATFVKVPDGKDGKPDHTRLEAHTISWMPASLNVVVLRLRPEEGTNLDLKQSLQLAVTRGAGIHAWGPYEIKKDLFDRAVVQVSRLKRGEVAYKAAVGPLRPDIATNCIHAISDIVAGPFLNTGTAFDLVATEMVITHLSPWIVDRATPNRSLLAPLGVDKYALIFRK